MKIQESIDELLQVAEIDILYKKKKKGTTKIKESREAVEIFRKVWEPDLNFRERAYVMYLNRANNVMAVQNISFGGLDGTVVDNRILFGTALKMLASGIILAHNHPTGNLQPSQIDKNLTKKVKEGGALLDIVLLDHVIITEDSYTSFADEKIL
jgi:DNA repair protein RadC